MRALVQVVSQASVEVAGDVVGSCGQGLLVLVGVAPDDTPQVAGKLWHKVSHLRIFPDESGRTNLSVRDVGGGVLVVSQFTLFADCRHGNRPSFTQAAPGPVAEGLYDEFCRLAQDDLGPGRVGRGVFGAHMRVSLVNEGPFTIWLDTDEL